MKSPMSVRFNLVIYFFFLLENTESKLAVCAPLSFQNLIFYTHILLDLFSASPANLQIFPPPNGGYLPPESPYGMHVKLICLIVLLCLLVHRFFFGGSWIWMAFFYLVIHIYIATIVHRIINNTHCIHKIPGARLYKIMAVIQVIMLD